MAESTKAYTIKDDNEGQVHISDDVFATIVALSATEVEGVLSIGENLKHEQVAKSGVKANTKGIKIEVVDGVVSIDLALKLSFGASIPKVVAAVQDKVSATIDSMTSMDVAEINVNIIGVGAEEE